MRVRVLYGRNAGEIVDLPYVVARANLEQGRALLPDAAPVSLTVAPPVEAATITAGVDLPRPKRRGKR